MEYGNGRNRMEEALVTAMAVAVFVLAYLAIVIFH